MLHASSLDAWCSLNPYELNRRKRRPNDCRVSFEVRIGPGSSIMRGHIHVLGFPRALPSFVNALLSLPSPTLLPAQQPSPPTPWSAHITAKRPPRRVANRSTPSNPCNSMRDRTVKSCSRTINYPCSRLQNATQVPSSPQVLGPTEPSPPRPHLHTASPQVTFTLAPTAAGAQKRKEKQETH